MLWIIGGVVVGLAALSAASVALSWCPSAPVAMAQLLLPWWFVMTVVVVIVSAVRGTWGLAAIGAVVALGALLVMWPKLRRKRRPRQESVDASLSVVLANLYIDNEEPDEAIGQLFDQAPDVLVMTELTVELLDQFDRLGGAERYPNRIHPDPIQGEYAVGIFTALPFDRATVTQQGPLEVVEATVDVPGFARLRVIAVHPEAPVGAEPFRKWRHQLRELEGVLAEATGATIVIGDMNSGTLHPPYERLFRTRFRDAHDLLGTALRPSWGVAPWFPRWFPTLLARLDHLLVSDEVTVVSLEDLDAVGSDHRPFRAELALAE